MKRIVVIGGGVAGLSVAAELAQHAHVTLLETETSLGYHTSGRSAAAFLGFYGNTITQALNAATLPKLLSVPDVASQRGYLLLCKEDEADAFEAAVNTLGLTKITFAQASEKVGILNPETCVHCAWHPDVYDLDTDLLLQYFQRSARTHGAKIVTGVQVSSLSHGPNGWLVGSDGQQWQADIVVNAAGAWADDIAAMAGLPKLGIQPMRRSMARIDLPAGTDCAHWPFFEGLDNSWYAKPDAGALIVSPADEDPVAPQDAWADDMVLAEGLARYEEMVTAPVTRLLANWAGLRSFAPDRSLVIGPDATNPEFVWLAGQGGYGFQTCFAAAQLTADLILGRTPELPDSIVAALLPSRFS